MHIRRYLCREAQRITERSAADITDAEKWRATLKRRREKFLQMMGVDELLEQARETPLQPTVTGVVERPGCRIENLYYQALPNLYVAGNLYLPAHSQQPRPAVLYVCGHWETGKSHFQDHALKWAQLGFACLVIDSIWGGEVRGHHHGCYREGWFNWYSRGYTPAGMELLTGSRALDLLCTRPEVDGSRLGVTGISGGGASTWWIAAGDERIGCAAAVCGTASLASQICDRTVDGHCDCMWFINTALWDYPDIGALIAPRPFMIASADADPIFEIRSVRAVYQKLRRVYDLLGAGDKVKLVDYPGGHGYTPLARREIFAWFVRHLMGRDVSPQEVGDIDQRGEAAESDEALRVFVNGPLPEDLTPNIHEHVLHPAPPPVVRHADDVQRLRSELVEKLRADCFAHFPPQVSPDVEVTQRLAVSGARGYKFAFTSEEGLRLRGWLMAGESVPKPSPAVVVLRCRGEGRSEPQGFASGFTGELARIVVDVRGTGETAWGRELDWHIRRAAAWTGRTVASMWTWDVLRALAAIRSLEEIDGQRLALVGRGEMCVPALYAALLDGQVWAVLLQGPPASHDVPGPPDGTGQMLEVLRVLRYTDLAYAAGMLWPTTLVLGQPVPQQWWWAVRLYQRLGEPGQVEVVGDVRSWQPR